MTFQVRLLRRGQADADGIFLWLRKRSPAGAVAGYAALLKRLDDLSENATACSIAPEAQRLGVELRQAFFKTRRGRKYRLLFVMIGTDVRVLRVRGPGQRPITRRDLPSDER
jgi:plasmid stabilization system protein ParE